jgi:hypothetical protein
LESLPVKNAEPELYPIYLSSLSWSEVQLDVRMSLKPLIDELTRVSSIVIQYDMKFPRG